ncbi:hypothetical protein MY4824_004563 [Beauveria thailandica]
MVQEENAEQNTTHHGLFHSDFVRAVHSLLRVLDSFDVFHGRYTASPQCRIVLKGPRRLQSGEPLHLWLIREKARGIANENNLFRVHAAYAIHKQQFALACCVLDGFFDVTIGELQIGRLAWECKSLEAASLDWQHENHDASSSVISETSTTATPPQLLNWTQMSSVDPVVTDANAHKRALNMCNSSQTGNLAVNSRRS